MVTTDIRVGAAASRRVADLLSGPHRELAVVAAGPHAVYLAAAGECLAVLAADAVAVPVGLRTSLDVLPHLSATVTAVAGDGSCLLGDHEVVIRRIAETTVPSLGPLDRRSWPSDVDLRAATDELPSRALHLLADGDPAAVHLLLGLGSGLTPTGDDVLSGWLVTMLATGQGGGDVAAAVAALAAGRTTVVSAALLAAAARGEAVPQLRDALLALRTGTGVGTALGRLLDVGHTSGAGLALGIRTALVDPPPRRHR